MERGLHLRATAGERLGGDTGPARPHPTPRRRKEQPSPGAHLPPSAFPVRGASAGDAQSLWPSLTARAPPPRAPAVGHAPATPPQRGRGWNCRSWASRTGTNPVTVLLLQLVKKVVQSGDTACLQPTLDVFSHEDRQLLRGHCHARALAILRARPSRADSTAHTREAIAYLSLAIFAAGRSCRPTPGIPTLCQVHRGTRSHAKLRDLGDPNPLLVHGGVRALAEQALPRGPSCSGRVGLFDVSWDPPNTLGCEPTPPGPCGQEGQQWLRQFSQLGPSLSNRERSWFP